MNTKDLTKRDNITKYIITAIREVGRSIEKHIREKNEQTWKNSQGTFTKDVTLEKIWRTYTFDKQLRLIILDALERVEIA